MEGPRATEHVLVGPVFEGRPARFYRAFKNAAKQAEQGAELLHWNVAGTRRRMHPGEKTRFVRVDAAQPGDGMLVEQYRFDFHPPTVSLVGQGFRVEVRIQGLGAEGREHIQISRHLEQAEGPWIGVDHLSAIVEPPHRVGVFAEAFRICRRWQLYRRETARHSQMNQQVLSGIQREIKLFAPPRSGGDDDILHALGKLSDRRASDPLDASPGTHNPPAHDHGLELATHCLDFRQLRH